MFPKHDLTSVLTYEALQEALEESYDPITQQFTTKNDEEINQQYGELLDDDVNEWLDLPDEDMQVNTGPKQTPKVIIGAEKLMDFTGDNDTVSTVAHESGSVAFSDIVEEQSYQTEEPAASISKQLEMESNHTATTSISTVTTMSQTQEARIQRIEKANDKMQTDVATILSLLKQASTGENQQKTTSGDSEVVENP